MVVAIMAISAVVLLVALTRRPQVRVESGSWHRESSRGKTSWSIEDKGEAMPPSVPLRKRAPHRGPVETRADAAPVGTGARTTEVHGPLGISNPKVLQLYRRYMRDRRDPYAWIELAKALDRSGMPEEAIAALERALKYGGDFNGRTEVVRVLKEYKRWMARIEHGTAPSIRMGGARKPSESWSGPGGFTRGSRGANVSNSR